MEEDLDDVLLKTNILLIEIALAKEQTLLHAKKSSGSFLHFFMLHTQVSLEGLCSCTLFHVRADSSEVSYKGK